MSYRIKYDEITEIQGFISQEIQNNNEQLGFVNTSLNQIINLVDFEGKSATQTKHYLKDVHGTLQESIVQLFQEYQIKFLLFKDGYYSDIDNHLHAELDEDTFVDLETFYNSSASFFNEQNNKLDYAIQNVMDLLSVDPPSPFHLNNNYSDMKFKIPNFREKVGEYEYRCSNESLSTFEEILTSFRSLVSEYMNQNTNFTINYAPNSITKSANALALFQSLSKSYEEMAKLEGKINQAIEHDQVRFEQLEKELADARLKKGIWDVIKIVATTLAGAVVIVASGGLATPLVIATTIVGSAYNASNLIEAGGNIYYGLQGDGYSKAFNLIRDTLFFGNDSIYHTTFGVSLTLMGFAGMGQNLSSLANFKNTLISSGAVFGTDYLTKKVAFPILSNFMDEYDAQRMSEVLAIGTSTFAGFKINDIMKKRLNSSGNENKEFDYKKKTNKLNHREQTLATRKEIKVFKEKWGKAGIKVIVDKKGKVLNGNREAGFDYASGKIYIKKKPTLISMSHEGYHAEQWLELGQEEYLKLGSLAREEYVFEQIIKNKSSFDSASIEASFEYIMDLRGN